MESNNLPHSRGIFTRHIFTITFAAIIAMIIGHTCIWYYSNRELTRFKSEMRDSYSTLVDDGYHRPIEIETSTSKDGTLTLDKKEFEKINSYLDYLSSEIKRESNRAESIIDKDLDRLNLYMAVGIGFMTLLGVFVPILVNLTTSQELRSRQEELKSRQEKMEQDYETIKAQGERLPDLERKLVKFQEESKIAEINNANQDIQSAVGRFLYIGPTLLSSSNSRSLARFINLIRTLKESILKFSELEGHSVHENEIFKTNLEDLIEFLDTERFKFQIVLNKREDVNEIDTLIIEIKELITASKEKEQDAYQKVFNALDVMMDTVKNKTKVNEDKTTA